MKKFEEKTISEEKIFEGRVISLFYQQVELPNGKTSTREIVKHPGAVAIIPVTDEGKIVLVDQYRKPMERVLLEIPAGKLEKGEEPLRTAIRELEEETGYEAAEWNHIQSFYTSPGFADEYIHIYLATGLRKKENSASLDEDEFVEVRELSLEECLSELQKGAIHDAKTCFAIQYLQLKK
ncbi:NUDIX hydrolase [Bacillus sp. RG28]|uniref:NUDIX hydrolase n=1 Tax=Gottfriedia endophytica TaxID=2820819 RepID=A0A940SIY0_9BACI|nr:NUDIX hydrolase [Gottfriedia endophytica]MBP0724309.1 NUDIX hydrolase [Gottfriedia endophytica]